MPNCLSRTNRCKKQSSEDFKSSDDCFFIYTPQYVNPVFQFFLFSHLLNPKPLGCENQRQR